MSIFDRYISVYNGVTDRTGAVTLLGNFLFSKRHIGSIQALRRETDIACRKSMKLSLPMATVSGVFSPTRKIEYLQAHSGFICIDLDAKDNPHLSVEDMRRILSDDVHVAYASLSVSGEGMFGIIPLAYPNEQKRQFEALKQYYSWQYNVKLDDCGDVTRLRALSYDEHPYINEGAVAYDELPAKAKPVTVYTPVREDNDYQKAIRCTEVIEQNRIDITGSYGDWVAIGMALTSFGEDGRSLFHRVSRIASCYRFEEADRKFTQLLHTTCGKGIGTFFYMCSQYGVNYCRRSRF